MEERVYMSPDYPIETEADLKAMILTLQTQVDQLADKVDTLEARLAGAVSEIEKLKRGIAPSGITNAVSDYPIFPVPRGRG